MVSSKTITKEYYSALLDKVREKNRHGIVCKWILSLQDNAIRHKSQIAMYKLRDLGFE